MASLYSQRRSLSFHTFAGKVVLGVAGARGTTALLGRGQVHAPSLGGGRAVMQSGLERPLLARCERGRRENHAVSPGRGVISVTT